MMSHNSKKKGSFPPHYCIMVGVSMCLDRCWHVFSTGRDNGAGTRCTWKSDDLQKLVGFWKHSQQNIRFQACLL